MVGWEVCKDQRAGARYWNAQVPCTQIGTRRRQARAMPPGGKARGRLCAGGHPISSLSPVHTHKPPPFKHIQQKENTHKAVSEPLDPIPCKPEIRDPRPETRDPRP